MRLCWMVSKLLTPRAEVDLPIAYLFKQFAVLYKESHVRTWAERMGEAAHVGASLCVSCVCWRRFDSLSVRKRHTAPHNMLC